jgi:hypothetical protein
MHVGLVVLERYAFSFRCSTKKSSKSDVEMLEPSSHTYGSNQLVLSLLSVKSLSRKSVTDCMWVDARLFSNDLGQRAVNMNLRAKFSIQARRVEEEEDMGAE